MFIFCLIKIIGVIVWIVYLSIIGKLILKKWLIVNCSNVVILYIKILIEIK